MRYHAPMPRWLGVLAAVALTACAKDERAPFFDPLQYHSDPLREALERSQAELVQCDISEEDCQVMLFDAVSDARGTTGRRPPTRIVSPNEFEDRLRSLGAGAPPEELLRMLSLLDLLSPELTGNAVFEGGVEGIAAAYFFDEKDVLVIDWGMDLDSEDASLTLAHEYTHALQDSDRNLDALNENVDSTNAHEGLLGLVEGEAELYATLVVAGSVTDSASVWRRMRSKVIEAALDSPAPFFIADTYFPYTMGHEFMAFTWLDGGNDAVASLYDDVPDSSRRILAGAGTGAPSGGWAESLDDTTDGNVPAGFNVVNLGTSEKPALLEDSFGAWILHVFLEQMAAHAGAREVRTPDESVAAQLRGDRVIAFERDDAMVVVWRMRFEPDVDPAEVVAEIKDGAPEQFRVREEAGEVLLFAGEPADALDEFATRFALPNGNTGGTQTGTPQARRSWRPPPMPGL